MPRWPKMNFQIVEDEQYLSLMLNGGLCKRYPKEAMEKHNLSKEEIIGEWFLDEVRPHGGKLR